MKSKLFTLALLSVGVSIFAQVGINSPQPQASLDVVGFPSDKNKLDGIIAPRITGVQLNAKSYTTAQTGAIVYVTSAETAPTGQTVDVITPGYYYFDGTKWGNLNANWRTVGNSGTVATSSTLGTDISGGNYLGTSDGQSLVLATQKNVKGILDVNGTLQGGNSNNATGAYAAFSWGSNNTTNSTSSNIALGRNNTATAINANFPAVAIGANNSATSGAKIIGNSNTAVGANHLVFGNTNTVTGTAGLTLGNLHTNKGGIAIGSGNTVDLNSMAVGSASSATGGQALAIGFSGTAGSGQTVFANKSHAFFNVTNGTDTIVGINMVPTADTATGAALQLKGIATSATTCSGKEEGAIRYNSTARVHEGCNGTSWKALY
ncbi:hypothetical protein DRF65_08040 [Chryseobacterium pennae]|uniref:Trimeric autotransporter adhesin YadA-like head domain-containing protein n=1 Tax=Chryseobacterium pennae TaxID=2258962 RepID=A0A3D9CA62_9FLAO|nr:hypothetical protein [Chryseobacterium pennae]REC62763.1 hypothetical protein DRF65_08040 [Chryseobacterium pennae]